MIRGRVHGGLIETEEPLPEGAHVVVCMMEVEPFDLDEADVVELVERMAGVQRGETESSESLFRRLLEQFDDLAREAYVVATILREP